MLKRRESLPYLLVLHAALPGCIPGAAGSDGGYGGAGGSQRNAGGASGRSDNPGSHYGNSGGGGTSPIGSTGGRRSTFPGGATGAAFGGGGFGAGGSGVSPSSGGAGPNGGGAGGIGRGGAGGGTTIASRGGTGAGTLPSACPAATNKPCTTSTWPGGVVHYAFSSGFAGQQEVRAAMDRWQAASSNAVRFAEDATARAKVTIAPCSGGAEAPGYSACTSGCTAEMCGSIDHQLGHVIGLDHEHQRYDRDHYLRLDPMCTAAVPRCDAGDQSNDFGPFDYASSMLYPVTEATEARWDGTPVCGAGLGRCTASATGPGAAPTPGDGAAVVELYSPEWKRFARTVSASTEQRPLSDDISPAAHIPKSSSPAVESWEGGSLAIYVRADDGGIYKKYLDASSGLWTEWMSLGAPQGSAPVSDPAITSSQPGRSDLVVVRDGKVFIMSTPTWNNWQALPTPPVTAVSAPAITSWGPDRLDVFVRGVDNQVYQETCTASCAGNAGDWGDWVVVPGGLIKARPAAVARTKGIIDVFVHGMDDYLWTSRYTESASSPWSGYSRIDTATTLRWDANCPDCGSPAATSHDGTTADVFVPTNDDHVATGSLGPSGWSGFTLLGGVTSGAPAAVSQGRTSNRWDLVVVMPEENDAGELRYGTWWKSRS